MRPTRVLDRYWLQAWGPNRDATPRVGKWLIRVPTDELDEAWNRVNVALQAGLLGPSAKARTGTAHPLYADDVKVICVYTKDSKDTADKTRVRRQLRRLGFKGHLTYRTDAETLARLGCMY